VKILLFNKTSPMKKHIGFYYCNESSNEKYEWEPSMNIHFTLLPNKIIFSLDENRHILFLNIDLSI